LDPIVGCAYRIGKGKIVFGLLWLLAGAFGLGWLIDVVTVILKEKIIVFA
jgi:hypothetical protein